MKHRAALFVLPVLSIALVCSGCASTSTSTAAPQSATASANAGLDPLWTPPEAWEMKVADKQEVAAPEAKAVRAHASDHPNVASKAKSSLFVLGRKSR
jgi:uncharacterized protein YceK